MIIYSINQNQDKLNGAYTNNWHCNGEMHKSILNFQTLENTQINNKQEEEKTWDHDVGVP